MYGTGVRGAESTRVRQANDKRIKNRVYFYTETADGLMRPESGVGSHVYRQKFNNVLDTTTGNAKELVALVKD